MSDAPTLLQGATLPPCLRDLPEPPTRAFVHGELPRGPAVAIVGTRHPTEPSLEYASALARELCGHGVAIVSGGAEGIDTAAHRGALAGGGPTVVVAPSSFDQPFPKENAALYREVVAEGGAYISKFERDVRATQAQFFERNSWLVALSALVIVVELPWRSGAANAAKWARRLGRPVLVVLHPPWNDRGTGCIEQLRLGARPLGSVKDVMSCLEELNQHPLGRGLAAQRAPSSWRRSLPADTTPLEHRIYAAVLDGAVSADDVVEVTRDSAAEVNQGVLMMILKGLIAQDGAGTLSVIDT
ncbi:MAG: DNA-processing protein DprA [Polyangiaceae bacterium]